jgi:hypothetical protein
LFVCSSLKPSPHSSVLLSVAPTCPSLLSHSFLTPFSFLLGTSATSRRGCPSASFFSRKRTPHSFSILYVVPHSFLTPSRYKRHITLLSLCIDFYCPVDYTNPHSSTLRSHSFLTPFSLLSPFSLLLRYKRHITPLLSLCIDSYFIFAFIFSSLKPPHSFLWYFCCRYKRHITPLLSLCIDFYCRVFCARRLPLPPFF